MVRAWNPIKHPLENQYRQQMRNAWKRGIEWKLTFRQWLKLWTDSGHLHERGRGVGKYAMSRFADEGAYEIGNVRIVSYEKNCAESFRGCRHLTETKKRMSIAQKGNKNAIGNKNALGNQGSNQYTSLEVRRLRHEHNISKRDNHARYS